MKKNYVIVFIFALNISLFGQNTKDFSPIEKIIDVIEYKNVNRNINKFFIFNNDTITFERKNKERFYNIRLNNKITDTVPFSNLFQKLFLCKKDTSVYFVSHERNRIFYSLIDKLNLKNGKYTKLDSIPANINVFYNGNFLFQKDIYTLDIHSYSVENKKKTLFLQLKQTDLTTKYHKIIDIYTFGYGIYLLQTALDEAEPSIFVNYIYNFFEKSLKQIRIDTSLKEYERISTPFYKIITDEQNNYCLYDKYLLDKNFNFKGYALYKDLNIKGYNIQNNKIVSYFVSSSVGRNYNEKKSIPKELHKYSKGTIIPYRFVYELERNMFFIKNDTTIDETDLKNMEQVDLKILRNMIYAKHAYIFKSHYLVLLFKLYNFYKPAIINKSEVENKFTEQDKENSKLIDKYLK